MRIAFDHQIFGWQEYGGVSRYVYELAKELAASQGQDVHVVSPLYVNEYLKHAPKSLNVWGVPIVRVPKAGRAVRAVNSIAVGPLLKWLAPDIVHETYYAGSRLAPSKSKVVLTVHDMIHERFPESFRTSDPTTREKIASVTRADHVICVSRQTQRDLIEFTGIDPAKTSVVYHGFTLTADRVQESDVTHGKPYLLYVGNRGGYKNFEGMLRAVAASPMLRREFRILCFGGGVLTRRDQALMQELGFGDNDVRQLSGSDALLAWLYQRAAAFVYPSLYEGFGIPPLEAMSFGCPVACSSTSSIPEVVGDAGVYFDPGDVGTMRTVIETLVTDENLRSRLIHAGRERTKEFSWERCASETLDVYRRTLT